MPKPLWAPWRLEYIGDAETQDGCVFCLEAAGELPEAESLAIHRGMRAFVLLNKYPYSSGHLMVAPVRHVGEAAAVILAESRYAAEDAAQLVSLDLDPLPAVVDPEQALHAGAPIIHEKFATNLIGAFTIGKGDNIDAALARAPHRLQRRFHHHRYAAAPMECRGVVGVHDPRTDSVTIWSATQVVHWVRREAAAVLQLPEARLRCLALDVGGGFAHERSRSLRFECSLDLASCLHEPQW